MLPIDTFENNRPVSDFRRRELFAYPPNYMKNNIIRDVRWWNTLTFFKRTYREGSYLIRHGERPNMQ